MKPILLMRTTAFFSFFFITLFSVFSACKEEECKQELLIGKWVAVSAVKSNGDSLVYNSDDSRGELTLEFVSAATFLWEEKITNKSTGLSRTPFRARGNYTWGDCDMTVMLLPFGVPTVNGTAEVSFSDENTVLNIIFYLTDDAGSYTIEVKAEKQ